jgi:hypothetical protein
MKCIESGLVRVGAPYVEPHPEDEQVQIPAAVPEAVKEENSEYADTAARKKAFLAAKKAAAEEAAKAPTEEVVEEPEGEEQVQVEAEEPAYEVEEEGEEEEQQVEEESAAGGAAEEGEVDALAEDLGTIAIRKRGGAKK